MNRERGHAPECAQCGEFLFLPEWSEHLKAGCVRHLWKCDACGYSFETVVRLAIEADAADAAA
jgi:hypothetical protein